MLGKSAVLLKNYDEEIINGIIMNHGFQSVYQFIASVERSKICAAKVSRVLCLKHVGWWSFITGTFKVRPLQT